MNAKTLSCLLVLLFIVSTSFLSKGQGGESLCNRETVSNIIKSRLEEYTKKINGLKNLLQGTSAGKFQASDYFPIDINNEKEIADYRKSLQKLIQPAFKDVYPHCAGDRDIFLPDYKLLQSKGEELNRLKLEFLMLSTEYRKTIIRLSAESSQSSRIIVQLKDEQQSVLKEYYNSLVSSGIAREKSQQTESEWEKGLYAEIISLENIRSRIVFLIIKILQANEKLYLQFQEYSEILSSSLSSLQKDLTSSELIVKYSEVNSLWSRIIDIGLKEGDLLQTEDAEIDIRLPDMKYADKRMKKSEAYRLYLESFRKTDSLYKRLNRIYTLKKQNLVETHYKLIRDASSIRSKYFIQLAKTGKISLFRLDSEFLHDIRREILIVPYRLYIFSLWRWIDFKNSIERGFAGILALVKSLLLLILLFSAPFILFKVIKTVSGKIEDFRHKLMNVRKPTLMRLRISLFLKQINPYMPYLLSYLLIKILYGVLEGTYFHELVNLLPYFTLFIVYRVFMVFFKSSVKKIIVRSSLYTVLKYEKKIHTTARGIGLYFLTVLFMLHATETSVGEAYIYFFVEKVLYYISILVFFITAYAWRYEVSIGVEKNFSYGFIIRLSLFSRGKPGILITLPLLTLVFVKKIYQYIAGRIFKLEFARKTIARLLRKQMEAAGARVQETDIDTIPDEYKKLFSMGIPKYDDIWVYPHTEDIDDSMTVIRKWINNESEEISLALCGEKGMGKSSLLEILSHKIQEDHGDITIINETVPPKLVSPDETLQFFEKILKTDLEGKIEALVDWDSKAGKHILMLDDAHNFFIARVGGFEGFQSFLKIINLRLANLFICATFNIHSWIYLEGVFARNRYFRNVVKMHPWKEEDIRELISTRNRKSGLKIIYDRIISASLLSSEIESHDNIEMKFFRLLWEQSEGNPRAAIYTWLTCIKPDKNIIRVGLPHDPEINVFAGIHTDALFTYASIARHENIAIEELIHTTSLPEGMLEYAVKIGMERDFLYRSEKGRYRINPSYHNLVINYLIERNLLYADR